MLNQHVTSVALLVGLVWKQQSSRSVYMSAVEQKSFQFSELDDMSVVAEEGQPAKDEQDEHHNSSSPHAASPADVAPVELGLTRVFVVMNAQSAINDDATSTEDQSTPSTEEEVATSAILNQVSASAGTAEMRSFSSVALSGINKHHR